MTKESIDYWFSHITSGENLSKNILDCLYGEIPLFISWLGERTCNLQCTHCIFQAEKSYGENKEIGPILQNLVSLIKKHRQPIVIHEGRILRRWHLPIMKSLQEAGALVGLIDNGTYLHHLDFFQRKLDWIDISIDGTLGVHNRQRGHNEAYQTAIKGLKRGRGVANKVTSLFTLTALNYDNVYDATVSVIEDVDEFHITPVSPARQEIVWTEASIKQFCVAWKQIRKLKQEYPEKVFVRAYRHEDLVKLSLIDPKAFANAIRQPIGVSQGRIVFKIHGVEVSYLPKSLSINETIVVDTDGWYRLPYSIALTLHELVSGKDRFGNNVKRYSIAELTKNSDIYSIYRIAVDAWWQNFGKQSLYEEKMALNVY
jgi:MoaA/NifB/PqqE/SkfB family radical SAM enzyme